VRNTPDGQAADRRRNAEASGGEQNTEPGPDNLLQGESAKLRKLARLGAVALSARTALIQFAALGGQVILARRLAAEDFGVFAVVQFAMTFLTFFGDGGLGAALVQKKREPSSAELSSIFYLQACLGVGVLLLALAGGRVFNWAWPNFPPSTRWVLVALAFNFLLTSLRCVPGLLLERRLQFVRIAILDTCGSITFYAVAAGLALSGFRIGALVGGVLAQGACGLALAYVMCPWRPSLEWDFASLRPLLRFGVPFQLHFVSGLVLSALTPVFGGRVLGAHAVGLLNWSQTTAHFPLALGHIISRISFPLYSRLQDDRQELVRAVGRSIKICALGTMLFVGVVMALAPELVRIVYSEKWLEALPFLYVYTATITVGFFTPAAATVLEALGKPGVVLRLSAAVVGLIWVVVPPATLRFGTMGFVGAYVGVMVLGNVAMAFTLRRLLPDARLITPLLPALLATLFTAVCGRLALLPRVMGPASLAAAVVGLVVLFASITLLIDRELWRTEVAPRFKRYAPKVFGARL